MRLLHRNRAGNARPTLGRVLQRVHLGLALIAVGTAGIFLTLVALFALRAYADHNLHLIARSISYTVEAAVVFEDGVAAREALMLIASNEEILEARILDNKGKMLASWRHPPTARCTVWSRWLRTGRCPSRSSCLFLTGANRSARSG